MAIETKAGILATEEETGTAGMVAGMEAAYRASCAHNEVSTENLEYFRAYIFNHFCMLIKALAGEMPKIKMERPT